MSIDTLDQEMPSGLDSVPTKIMFVKNKSNIDVSFVTKSVNICQNF